MAGEANDWESRLEARAAELAAQIKQPELAHA